MSNTQQLIYKMKKKCRKKCMLPCLHPIIFNSNKDWTLDKKYSTKSRIKCTFVQIEICTIKGEASLSAPKEGLQYFQWSDEVIRMRFKKRIDRKGGGDGTSPHTLLGSIIAKDFKKSFFLNIRPPMFPIPPSQISVRAPELEPSYYWGMRRQILLIEEIIS